jgi:hypothetical protein
MRAPDQNGAPDAISLSRKVADDGIELLLSGSWTASQAAELAQVIESTSPGVVQSGRARSL